MITKYTEAIKKYPESIKDCTEGAKNYPNMYQEIYRRYRKIPEND